MPGTKTFTEADRQQLHRGIRSCVETWKINACEFPHVNEGKKKNLDRQIASVRENCENGHFIYLNSSVKLAQKESL